MGSTLAELIECETHHDLASEIKYSVALAFNAAEERKRQYEPHRLICAENQLRNASVMKQEYTAGERSLLV